MDAPRRRLAAPVVLAVASLTAALAGGQASGANNTASAARTTSTKAGLKQATWGTGITITYSGTTVRLRSNGIPNHARPAQYAVPTAGGGAVPTAATAAAANDPTKAQSYDFTIPTRPTKTAKTTAAPLGSIGLMISGAVLFNPYEGDGKTAALASNFTVKGDGGADVPFVDACSGHPTPMAGQYHYHGLPACVTAEVDTSTGPSHIIGIAFDGFPIYGARDIKGRKISVSKLDACNGTISATPEFPKGIYHYVLPGTTDSTSSIRCFHGKVSATISTRMPAMGGGPPPAVAATASVAARSLCDLLGFGI